MIVTRRTLIGSIPVLGLAACTTSTTNGVTTVTLNVQQVQLWATALVNASNLVASLPGIAGTAPALVVAALGPIITADIAAFAKTAGSAVSLTFTTSSVPAAVASLETDANILLNDAKSVVTGVAAADLGLATTYVNAIETVVTLLEAAVGSVPAAAKTKALPMTEAQALAVLKK